MHQPTASEELITKLKLMDPQLDKVYVGSIFKKDIFTNNNYIHLLYKDFSKNSIKVEYHIKDNYQEVVLRKIKGEHNIVHYHWLQFNDIYTIKSLCIVFFWLLIYKLVGGKVVWTLHNKYPHDNSYPRINRGIRICFAKIATKLHVHCNNAIHEMSTFLKATKTKFFVIRHPDYPVKFMPPQEALKEIKIKYAPYFHNDKNLQLHDEIYLMFGKIRPYKGIEELVDLFLDNSNTDKKLLIAGRVHGDAYGNRLIEKANPAKNIIIIPKFIPDADSPLFFNLCKYVVFNYKDVLTSGGAIEALNYKRIVIAPNKGCLSDLKEDQVIKFNNLFELRRILFSCYLFILLL